MHKTIRRFLAVAVAAAVMTSSGAMTVLADEGSAAAQVQESVETVADENTADDENLNDAVLTPVEDLEAALAASVAEAEADPSVEINKEVLDEYNDYLDSLNRTVPASGEAGSDAVYTFVDGVLTISGSGSVTTTAFWGSDEITKVVINDGITSLAGLTFQDCHNLTTVEGLDKVTSLGAGVFINCSSLTSVNLNSGLTSVPANIFDGCTKLSSIIIPSGVTTIGAGAFASCSALTSIGIPSNVTTIGESAFLNCSGLTSLPLPSGITTIQSRTFEGCTGLTYFVVPSGVTTIEYRAFADCSNLKEVYIPASTSIISANGHQGTGGKSDHRPYFSPFYGVDPSCVLYCHVSSSASQYGWTAYWNNCSDSAPLSVVYSTDNRISGDTRYDTAAKIAAAAFPNGAVEVVLCTGEKFPDALAAAGFAGSLNGGQGAPILLSDVRSLSSQVKSLLNAWGGTVKKVYIMGLGFSDAAKSALGVSYEVIGGATRYETALNIAQKVSSSACIVATGENYPDALSISSWAYAQKIPIILCGKNGLTDAAWSKVASYSRVYIVGGTAVVNDSRLNSLGNRAVRLAGATRYETSVEIAKQFTNVGYKNTVVFATGENFPDALAGACLAGLNGGSPIILVGSSPSAATSFIRSNYNSYQSTRYYLGGVNALSDATLNTLASCF